MMETSKITEQCEAIIIKGADRMENDISVKGIYNVKCFDAGGNLKWEDTAKNLVTTEGKAYLLNAGFRNSGYAVGYIGLISSYTWSAVAAGDTMASHSGWTECQANEANRSPNVATRASATFSADATSGTISTTAASFSIVNNGGTIKGCILNIGTGASSALATNTGKLYSAGVFTGGDKVVGVGDTVQVTYTTTLS